MFYADEEFEQPVASEHDSWFCQQVQVGLNSANAGRLVSAKEVEAVFALRRVLTRSKFVAEP